MIVKLYKRRERLNRVITGLMLTVEEKDKDGWPHPDVFRDRRLCREIAEAVESKFTSVTLFRNKSAVMKKEL